MTFTTLVYCCISIHSLHTEGDSALYFLSPSMLLFQSTPSTRRETCLQATPRPCQAFQSTPSTRRETNLSTEQLDRCDISIHSLHTEGDDLNLVGTLDHSDYFNPLPPHGGRLLDQCHAVGIVFISIHSLHTEGDCKTAQESVFHFAYPCTILQKRMQKTTFCTRKNGFFRKKGEKFGAKPSASFCAPMIRTDTFPLNFSHRISGSSMSMVSFAPICSTFD